MDNLTSALYGKLTELDRANTFYDARIALKRIAVAVGMPVMAWSPDVSRPGFDYNMDEFFRDEGWTVDVLSVWWARAVMLKNPIYIRCRTSALPFVTAPLDKVPPRSTELRRISAAMRTMNIQSLITVPIHLPRGLVAMVSLGGSKSKVEAKEILERNRPYLIAAGHLLMAAYASERAESHASEEELAHVTPREWECLRLTAQGCKEELVASMIGLGATTVRYHLDNVVRKLGASNRTHAVALAAQLGLIGPIG